jgi:hypothetical protein
MSGEPNFSSGRLPKLIAGAALAAALALGLSSCGGSSSVEETGAVNIGLTDAAGDFLTYAVDVTSLTLTKANGTVVQTLPQKTRIDFAQLVDLTEFVSGATIPAGNYVSATLQLDYNGADIRVDDGTGIPVPVLPGNIRDGQGVPVTTLTMTVRLDNSRPLPIAPGIPALLDLDFNLAASNSVDMSVPALPVVTVSPLLVADVNPDSPKPHRIRGPLDGVDAQAGSFTLILRPLNLMQGDHGRLTFFTDNNTVFEIDQTSYVGSTGFAALAAKSRLTATVAFGTLDLATRRFMATEVRAGSSVAFGNSDVLTGNVIARVGDTLTVKGAELVRSTGTLIFRDTVTVTVATSTKVLKQGAVGVFAKADISVGQRLTVLGTLNSGATALDATDGLVRLLVTQLNGHADGTPAPGGPVAMTLDRIDGRPIGLFDFSGTGTPNADPNSYQVTTGLLNLGSIANATPLRVRGFVRPFGQATATDDFNAITLIDVTNAPATLVVGWPLLGEAMPFNTYTATGMQVNLTNAGLLHHIFRAGIVTPLSTSDTPFVQAADPSRGLFVVLGVGGTVQIYTQLGPYQSALQADLAAGSKAKSFVAIGGSYVDATKTLTAGATAIVLH